jgi:quercetin dioxygenase-like cupin family protein
MLCEMTMKRDGEVPPHHHPYEQIGYVASGRLQFTVGDETDILESGDSYLIPPDVTHAVVALEDSVAIDVFGPPRPDYMD